MKKAKILVAAILRGALLLAPGALVGWWAWSKAPALITILAAVGLETMFLFVVSFISVAIQARRDILRKRGAEVDAVDEKED